MAEKKKIYPNDPCPCGSGKNIRTVVGEDETSFCEFCWRKEGKE
jgi:hypothetical protein